MQRIDCIGAAHWQRIDSLTNKREITRYFACALTALGPLEVESPWAIAHMVNLALHIQVPQRKL